MNANEHGFGIYIHWPFCAAKCPYCDFNSHVRHEPVNQLRFANAIVRELEHFAALTQNRTVDTVFFGGGTPSLMQVDAVETILQAIRQLWHMRADAEVTLEANPTSVEAGRFAGYRAAGVNRVSLGVQALNDDDLRFLGRMHSVKEALAAIELAQTHFERISFDLIYARPQHTLAAWQAELRQALALGTSHLSAYQLTIEAETMFAARFTKGDFTLPDEDLARALYDMTLEETARAGLQPYEISNYARDGQQAQHNLIYWRGGDWVGVGAGAHARLTLNGTRHSYVTAKHPETWLESVERDGHAIVEHTQLSRVEVGEELLMMGLRTREGVSLARLEGITAQPAPMAKIQELAADGFLVLSPNGLLSSTYTAWPVLNRVIRELVM